MSEWTDLSALPPKSCNSKPFLFHVFDGLKVDLHFLKFVLLPSLLPGECSVIGLAPRVLGRRSRKQGWHHGSATCTARVTRPDAQQGPELGFL